jgi:hypothetical protein
MKSLKNVFILPFTQIYRDKIVKLGLTTDPSNRLRGCKQLEINSWDIQGLPADPNEMYDDWTNLDEEMDIRETIW